MIAFLYLIISVYAITLGILIYGFYKIAVFKSNPCESKTQFTIVVPFRDEAQNLPLLLESFSKLNYPESLFEVILVDDESAEPFEWKDFNFRISMLKNKRISNSPKKDAITTAVENVKSEWIITTDADCLVPENWLFTLDQYIQNHDVSMIVGAVSYRGNDSFLHHFQKFDFLSLQGGTIGSFGFGKGFICNGANFTYKKSFFKELNGFEGNNQIASGDDVFLLQKAMSKFPKKVHYLKSNNNIVITKPMNSWKSLFHQRVRWVSKTSSFQSNFGIFLGLVVFSTNLLWIITVGSVFLGLLSFKSTLLFFGIKFLSEMILIQITQQVLKEDRLGFKILNSLFYPFFSVSVALYSMFRKYEWKGRKFKF